MLKNKFEEIKSYKLKQNVTKTVGTSASIIGGVITISSFIAAPFTGGTSVIAGAAVGAAIGLGGGVVNLATDIFDIFASEQFQNDIKNIVEKRNYIAEKLHRHMVKFNKNYDELLKSGTDKDTAVAICFGKMLKKGADLKRFVNVLKASKNFKNFGLRFGGKVWKDMSKLSKQLQSQLAKIGVQLGKKTSMTIARNLTVGLNSAFVIWDIVDLVNTWKNNHPTGDQIAETIEYFRSDVRNCQDFQQAINSFGNQENDEEYDDEEYDDEEYDDEEYDDEENDDEDDEQSDEQEYDEEDEEDEGEDEQSDEQVYDEEDDEQGDGEDDENY